MHGLNTIIKSNNTATVDHALAKILAAQQHITHADAEFTVKFYRESLADDDNETAANIRTSMLELRPVFDLIDEEHKAKAAVTA